MRQLARCSPRGKVDPFRTRAYALLTVRAYKPIFTFIA